MVEPLTIFGAIGTTAGLIAMVAKFLVSTGESLFKKYKGLQNMKERLGYWHVRLLVANQSLENYGNIWFSNDRPLSDKTCETRWGKKGYQEIRVMLQDIEALHGEIDGVLYKSWQKHLESRTPSRLDWKGYLKQRLRHNEQTLPENAGALRKILIAIFQVSTLHDSIERLRKRVEDLETFTRQTYWVNLGEQDHVKKITTQDIRRTDAEDQYLERLTVAMNGLYRHPVAAQENWMLVLGSLIFEHGLEDLRYGADCHVEFVIDRQGQYCLLAMGISLEPEMSVSRTEDSLSTDFHHSNRGVTLTRLLYHSKYAQVREAQKRLAFAKIAKNVAKSIPLLESFWTAKFCTCGIKTANDLCTFRHTEESCTRHSKQVSNNFYNFGLVLAQLGIGELYEEDNEYDLLRMVRRMAGLRYHDAMESCFDMGKLKYGCRAEHLKRALEAVLKPIQEYYNLVYEEVEEAQRVTESEYREEELSKREGKKPERINNIPPMQREAIGEREAVVYT